MSKYRLIYHAYKCDYVRIGPEHLVDCIFCHGQGIKGKDHDETCTDCNGHGQVWNNSGYAFKKYTLEPAYQ